MKKLQPMKKIIVHKKKITANILVEENDQLVMYLKREIFFTFLKWSNQVEHNQWFTFTLVGTYLLSVHVRE